MVFTDEEGPNQPGAISCEILWNLRNLTYFKIFGVFFAKNTFFAPLPPNLYKHNGFFGLLGVIFTKSGDFCEFY